MKTETYTYKAEWVEFGKETVRRFSKNVTIKATDPITDVMEIGAEALCKLAGRDVEIVEEWTE